MGLDLVNNILLFNLLYSIDIPLVLESFRVKKFAIFHGSEILCDQIDCKKGAICKYVKKSLGDILCSICRALNDLMAGPTSISSRNVIPLNSHWWTFMLGMIHERLTIGSCILVLGIPSEGFCNNACHPCIVVLIVGDTVSYCLYVEETGWQIGNDKYYFQ